MAFSGVWSIDVGRYSLKAVHLKRYGSQVVLQGTDRIEYDVGPEGIDHIGGAKEALQIFTSRNHVRDPVIVCLPGYEALSRFIKIVADSDKKLQELVQYEARQQIPFPIEEVVWDWTLVPREYMPGQEKEVGIFAARRETVDDVLIDLESYGLRAEMIAPSYLGLLNYVLYELRPRVPSVVLDIGGEGTSLVLIENGGFWIRPLPFSGSAVTRALRSRFKLTFAEAERLKKQAARSPEAVKIFKALQGVLGDLVSDIQTSIGFYRSQVNEASFKQIYLLGQGSYTLGLGKVLKERLGMRVLRPTSLARIRAGEGVDVGALRPQLPALAPAMGVGLQGVGLGRTNVNLMPREQQVQIAFARRKKLVFVAGAAMLLVLFFLGNYYNKLAARAAETLQEARAVVEDFRSVEKEIPTAYDIAALRAKLEALGKVGQERHFFDRALRAIELILGRVHDNAFSEAEQEVALKYKPLGEGPARSIFAVPVSDETAGKEQAKKFIEAVHRGCAWVVALEVNLQGEQTGSGRSLSSAFSSRTSKQERKPSAYEFVLTGAILSRETPDASLRAVEERVITPLRELFQKTAAIRDVLVAPPKAVKVDNPDSPVPALEEADRQFNKAWHLINPRELKRKESEEQATEAAVSPAEFGKYYIFKVRWVIGEGAPEQTEGQAMEGLEGQ